MPSVRICPHCYRKYLEPEELCPYDQSALLCLNGDHPRLGEVVDGRYLLLELLGKGGMGDVFLAWQSSMSRKVALKVISRNVMEHPEAVERFRREAHLTASLRCPHTVATYDFGSLADGSLFLAMEYLAGGTLDKVLAEEGHLTPHEACSLLQQICLSLEEAHELGIVHRDLKPGNIMVMPVGRGRRFAKVLDFGVAKWLGGQVQALTDDGVSLGTPIYMSPEQARGQEVGPTTDIYALGLVAFEMVTGERAFRGRTVAEIVSKHLDTPPPHVTDALPTLGPAAGAFDTIIQRCLAKSPADRFPDVASLRQALESLHLPRLECQTESMDPGVDRTLDAVATPAMPGYGVAERAALAAVRVEPTPGRKANHGSALDIGTVDTLVGPAPNGAFATSPEPASGTKPVWGRRLIWAGALVLAALVAGLVWFFWPQTDRIVSDSPSNQEPLPEGVATPGLAVRLLILPPETPQTLARDADKVLWPLLDRVLFNALDADERFYGGLKRVDPLLVAEEIVRRELPARLGDGDVKELAIGFQATHVLRCSVERSEGTVRLACGLTRLADGSLVDLAASHLEAYGAVDGLVTLLRNRLELPHDTVSEQALAAMLLGSLEGLAQWQSTGTASSRGERRKAYQAMLASKSDAVAGAWYRLMEYPRDQQAADSLRSVASSAPDPRLRELMREVGDAHVRANACGEVDLAAVAQAYPWGVGRLGHAACALRRGNKDEAMAEALAAFQDPRTRLQASRFLVRLLPDAYSCEESISIRTHIQQAFPENGVGWSALAYYVADVCGQADEAAKLVRVARSMPVSGDQGRYYVASNGLVIRLVQGDAAGVSESLADLLASYKESMQDHEFYLLHALALQMQGRFGQAMDVRRKGYEIVRNQSDDALTLMAATYFYAALEEGKREVADAVVADMERRFSQHQDASGNWYWADAMRLVLDYHSGAKSKAQVLQSMRDLGADIEKQLGVAGKLESEAQEALFLAHIGEREACKNLLFSASPGNRYLGGCRFLYGLLLTERGQWAEARAQFHQALTSVILGKAFQTALIPQLLLWEAKAAQKAGSAADSRTLYKRIVDAYTHADRELPEVIAAREALSSH